jgi:hypothetical protein
MKDKDIVRELAVKYKLDKRVISTVVRSPFLFVKDRMETLNDVRSIRIPYLGLFMFNLTKTQEDKQEMLLHQAIRDINKEADKSEDTSYKEGLQKAVTLIRELIVKRRGNPKDYESIEDNESV